MIAIVIMIIMMMMMIIIIIIIIIIKECIAVSSKIPQLFLVKIAVENL